MKRQGYLSTIGPIKSIRYELDSVLDIMFFNLPFTNPISLDHRGMILFEPSKTGSYWQWILGR